MPTSGELSKLLEGEISSSLNQERALNAETAQNTMPQSDFIDLALKLGEDDGLPVQLDGLPPIDFDTSFADMLGNQTVNEPLKYLNDSTVSVKVRSSSLDVNSIERDTLNREEMTNVIDGAHATVSVEAADRGLLTVEACTNRSARLAGDVCIPQPNVLHPNVGAHGLPNTRAIPDNIHFARLFSLQECQGVMRANDMQYNCLVPSSQPLFRQSSHGDPSESNIPPGSIGACMTRESSIGHRCKEPHRSLPHPSTAEIPHCKKLIQEQITDQDSLHAHSNSSVLSNPSIDRGQYRGYENSYPLSRATSTPTEGQRSSRNRYSKGAAPSHYCHICGRNSRIEFGKCHNLKLGLCRKVICEKCLILYEPDSRDDALDPNSDWKCTHCREKCPERARCKQYTQNNQKRRERKAREREERVKGLQKKDVTVSIEGSFVKEACVAVAEASPSHHSGNNSAMVHLSPRTSTPWQNSNLHSTNIDQTSTIDFSVTQHGRGITTVRPQETHNDACSDIPVASTRSNLNKVTSRDARSESAFERNWSNPLGPSICEKSPRPPRPLSIGSLTPLQLASLYERQQALRQRQGMTLELNRWNDSEKTRNVNISCGEVEGSGMPQFQGMPPMHINDVSDLEAIHCINGHEETVSLHDFFGNGDCNNTTQTDAQGGNMRTLSVNEAFSERPGSPWKRKHGTKDRSRGEVVRIRLEEGRQIESSAEVGFVSNNTIQQNKENENTPVPEQLGAARQSSQSALTHCAWTSPLQTTESSAHTPQHVLRDKTNGQCGQKVTEEAAVKHQNENSGNGVSPTGIMSTVFGEKGCPKEP